MKTTKKQISENTKCTGRNFMPKSFNCVINNVSYDYDPVNGQLIAYNHDNGLYALVLNKYYVNKKEYVLTVYNYINNNS